MRNKYIKLKFNKSLIRLKKKYKLILNNLYFKIYKRVLVNSCNNILLIKKLYTFFIFLN